MKILIYNCSKIFSFIKEKLFKIILILYNNNNYNNYNIITTFVRFYNSLENKYRKILI